MSKLKVEDSKVAVSGTALGQLEPGDVFRCARGSSVTTSVCEISSPAVGRGGE